MKFSQKFYWVEEIMHWSKYLVY